MLDRLLDGIASFSARLGEQLRGQKFRASVVVLFVALVWGAVSALRDAGLPSQGFWTRPAPSAALILGTFVVTASYGYFFADYGRTIRRRGTDIDLYEACQSIAQLIQSETIPPEAIGIHVWERSLSLPVGVLRSRLDYWPDKQPKLASPIVWRKGKGAIGACWAQRADVFADLESWPAMTRHDWENLSADQRYRLRWRDYENSKAFRAIQALAVMNEQGVFLGCISIDVREPGTAAGLKKAIKANDVALSSIRRVCNDVLQER